MRIVRDLPLFPPLIEAMPGFVPTRDTEERLEQYDDTIAERMARAVHTARLYNIVPRALVLGRRAYASARALEIANDEMRRGYRIHPDQVTLAVPRNASRDDVPRNASRDDVPLRVFDCPVYCSDKLPPSEVLAVACDEHL